MALASHRAHQLHAAAQGTVQQPASTASEVSSAQLSKLLKRDAGQQSAKAQSIDGSAVEVTSPHLASGLKLANSAYELSASDDDVIDLTALDDDDEDVQAVPIQSSSRHVLRLPFAKQPDIAMDKFTVVFEEEEEIDSDDEIIISKSRHDVTDRKGHTVSPNTIHSSIRSILQSNTARPSAGSNGTECKHQHAAVATSARQSNSVTQAKPSNLKRRLPDTLQADKPKPATLKPAAAESGRTNHLSKSETKQWGPAWDLPAFKCSYKPPTIDVAEQARFAAAAQKLHNDFAAMPTAGRRTPSADDIHDPLAKAARQQKLFEDARKRAQQQTRPAAPSNRSASASTNDLKFEVPSWFTSQSNAITECTAAVKYILSNQTSSYRCLCLAGEPAVLKDKEAAARQLSKHYKRISQLVHPDRHMQILNELKQSPSKQTTNVSAAAEAFKTLHTHYQTLKRVHGVQ